MKESLDRILGIKSDPGDYPCYWFDGTGCRFLSLLPAQAGSSCYKVNVLRCKPLECDHGAGKELRKYLKEGRTWCDKP